MALGLGGAVPFNAVAADQKLQVATSFTIIADMARNVAGDAADIVSITRPGAEIHDYQPTPRDIIKAQQADLILANGLGLERWYDRFLHDVPHVPSVVVSEGVDPLPIRQGPYQDKANPHAWMSIDNALIYVENIRAALSRHDPANAALYAANAAAYGATLKGLRAELAQVLSTIPPAQRTLVTSEGAFSYLARDFGMRELYLWPINADQQGTPQQVRAVIDAVRADSIPVVFSESTVSDKPARQVAAETGALYGGVLYVDSLSAEGGPVPTYAALMQKTTSTIAAGFLAAAARSGQTTP